jgi:hypothetical protein
MTTKVTGALQEDGTKGADIASASTLVVGTDGSYFDITGTTGITGFTVDAGRTFTLQFDGIVTLTNGASLVLSGAANFTTAAGDRLTFTAVAADTVVQVGHSLVSGGSPVATGGGNWELVSTQTASADASIDWTGLSNPATYAIVVNAHTPSNDGPNIICRIGDSGGFKSATYAHGRSTNSTTGGTAGSYASQASGSGMILASGTGTDTGENWSGIIFASLSSAEYSYFYGNYCAGTTVAGTYHWGSFGGTYSGVITPDRLQITQSSGNVQTGQFTLYRITTA